MTGHATTQSQPTTSYEAAAAQREARFLEALQAAGLRLTAQRRAICHYLARTDAHPTAQQIYEALKPQFPSLSLTTVYNTLDVLVRLGLVYALGGAGDRAVHYETNTEPHINLACLVCHRVIDLPMPEVGAWRSRVAEASGFKILGARLVYYGVCPECQRQNPADDNPPSE
ncbi:MAG: transcriptional repressor [Chloroflexi bacterium]|nr:transcriptional repressor [Chloroflexota bacterium]